MGEQKRYSRDSMLGWCEPGETQALDWKNAEDYAFVLQLQDRELAWEFLRRNQDYVKGFSEWAALRQNISQKAAESSYRVSDEQCQEWEQTLDQECDALCDQFGISKNFGIRHPDAGAPLFEVEDVKVCEFLRYWIDGVELPLCDDLPPNTKLCMDVRVVAERSIDEQLAEIRRWYFSMREMYGEHLPTRTVGSIRLQKSLYPEYLRILDAKSKGATNAEITAVLFPNDVDNIAAQKRLSERIKSARKIVNGGYLAIAGNAFPK